MPQPRAVPAAVEAVLAGDESRFRDVVGAFDGMVRRTVARTCRDAHAVEDVVQEVWIRVYRQLQSLLEVRAADQWIGRIARNCAHDHARRARRAGGAFGNGAVPVDELAQRSAAAPASWVGDLVAGLPRDLRELLHWRYADGLPYAEIAARLGVPTSTVRGRLYDARLRVRRLIEQRRTR